MTKIKSKRIGSFLFLAALVILAVYAWTNFRISPQKSLENFRLVTAEQPLFASDELNAVETEKSLAYFRKMQQQLMDDYFLDDEVTKTGFLNEIFKVQAASQDFKANPSKETAEKLNVSYREANQIYKAEIESLKDKIAQRYPASQNQPLIYQGSTSNNQIILADLDLMLQNSAALDKEIQKREKILNGQIGYKPETVNPKLPAENPTQTVDMSVVQNTLSGLVSNEGTFFVETACFQDSGNELPFIFSQEKNKDGLEYFIPKLANVNYYQKLNAGDAVEAKFLSQGYEWRRVREGNSYRCNDLSYYADLTTLRNFVKRYKASFLFEGQAPVGEEQKWAEAKTLEQRLLKKDQSQFYVSDLKELGNYYHFFWQRTGDKFSEDATKMRLRYLAIANKQDGIPAILNTNFSFDNLIFRFDNSDAKIPDEVKDYLFLSRNNYSYIFLNFSPSVWQLSEKPTYLTTIQPNGAFANTKTLENKYSLEQIKAFNTIGEEQILVGF